MRCARVFIQRRFVHKTMERKMYSEIAAGWVACTPEDARENRERDSLRVVTIKARGYHEVGGGGGGCDGGLGTPNS